MNLERDQALSLAFMRGHPAQAARVLESLPIDEAGALFARTPARLASAVLAAMLPQRAARCLAGVDDTRALELLAPMGTQPTVALLRHLPEPRRRELINGLPTASALASALLLGYTEDTLGAWADPDIVALPADTPAAAVLERLRLAPATHPWVFAVDAERRLAGVVPLALLVQSGNGATLATLMHPPVAVLTAHAPLSGTAAHPAWEQASLLPVVEPGERLIGVMTRDALARALRRSTAAAPLPALDDVGLPALFGRGYWQALSGLIGIGLALLPGVPPADHGLGTAAAPSTDPGGGGGR